MPEDQRTKAALFATCIVDQLYPQVGVSVVRVLRRLGVDLSFPPDQTCCGQPLYNSGFTHQAQKLARRVLSSFSGSQYVVVPSGSCSAMIKVLYQDLFRDDPATLQQVQQLAPRVYEFSQFLVDVLEVQHVEAGHSGAVTYHPSCHLLREMEVREQPQTLLNNVKGLHIENLPRAETCCGFGGTFAVKFPHISEGMVNDKVANILSTGADTVVPFEETDEVQRRDSGLLLDEISILADLPLGSNVRPAGEDVSAGQMVLAEGTPVRAAVIGVLASLGLDSAVVRRRPVVSILATGDEL